MNRIFIALLLFLGIFMLTCNNEDIESLHKDYRFKTKVETKSDLQNLCVNGAIPFTIGIEKNDPQIGSYDFSYSPVTGKGLLYYKDSLLNPYKPIVCNEDKLQLRYIPITLGDHQLRFDFKNDLINVSDALAGKTVKQYFQLKAKDFPSKPLIDIPFLFNIELSKPDDGIEGLYKATVGVTEGIGKALILNQNSNDSIQQEKYLSIGDNKISYIGNTEGIHKLHFTVTNSYGLSQNLDVPLEIQHPDYSITTICDTSIQSGKYSFILKVSDTDHHGKNSYWVSYRSIENEGSLKINNNPLEVGNTLQLKSGENICEFTPAQLGNTSLEFIVRDKYNTIRKDTALFNVGKATTEIIVSNQQPKSYVYDQQNFNIAIKRNNYEGQFQMEILQESAIFQLYINGVLYEGGRIPVLNKDNTLVSYIPGKTGNAKITLSLYDEYGSNFTKDLFFEIENSQGKINISNQAPSVNIYTPTSFNFSVSKPKYNNKYLFEIESIPVQSGTLKINGENYTGGKMEVENPDNTLVTFEPSRIGDITLNLNVYDIFGGILTKSITYSVANTDIQILVTNLTKELLVGKETSFTFTAEKPFFTQDLQCSITAEPADYGIIYINGEYILPGTNLKIKNKTSTTVSFLPQKAGEVILYINVCDNIGYRSYPVALSIINPEIKLEISNRPEKLLYNTDNRFSFSVNKESYKGKFKCKISTKPSQAGVLTINNQKYNYEEITLDHAENNVINFLPSITGEVDIILQISDETQSKTERTLSYVVENSPIHINLNNTEDDLSLYKPTSFSFTVSKNNYPGKYKFELFADNCSDLKVNNTPYINGEKQELTSPEGTSVSFIPSVTGTDTVKMQLRIFDEWGGNAEKKISFSVNNTDINCEVSNWESRILQGQLTNFILVAQKPQYHGKLDLEIVTTPDNCGLFTIDGKEYSSGKIEIPSGTVVNVSYTPTKEGIVKTDLSISDKFGGKKTRSLNYEVINPPINLEVNDFTSSAIINTESFFYVTARKGYYKDDLSYSISLSPANSGTIRVNDTITYNGGRIDLPNAKQNKFCFIPNTTGKISLKIKVSDKTGYSAERNLEYSVATFPINLTIANQETGLEINKATNFNFSVSKKGYRGKFLYEITSEPVKAGVLKIGNTAYEGGKQEVTNPDNMRITFIPEIIGDIKLFVTVYDNLEGSTTKELAYNVKNSDFEIVGSNLAKDILVGKPTEFNVSVIKQNYSGSYKYEIEQVPENAGTIAVNGSIYSSGKQALNNPVNSIISFTSSSAGPNTLLFRVYDANGGTAEQSFTFNAINPPITLKTTNKEGEVIIHTATNFNVAIDKQYYTGDFEFQIDQQPANSGELLINEQKYDGGLNKVENPQNLQIRFIPHTEKNVTLKLSVKDQVGGITEQNYLFTITNPPLELTINGHTPDIQVNFPTDFNFSVNKNNYPGKYYYQLEQQPANFGTIEINSTAYDGGKYLIENPSSNKVKFTASRLGAVSLTLHIIDEWGKEISESINYSVSNTDLKAEISNKENSLLLNKTTSFKLDVSKPNYNGSYHIQMTTDPENAGQIQINNSDYSSGWITITPTNNEIKFTPQICGSVLLKLKLKDDLEGEKEIVVNYMVENPDIDVVISNREDNLFFNTPTSFNATVSKSFYSDIFKYQITQHPANCGKILINQAPYEGGIQQITDPENFQITFIPQTEGNVALLLQVTDNVGGKTLKTLNFNVANPEIKINVTDHISDLIVNSPVTFNFTAAKTNYSGAFTYQITQNPAATGTLKVNASAYSGGKLPLNNPNSNIVEFTPVKLGAVTLNIKIADEWGKESICQVPFSISNSDIKITTNGRENSLLLNKATNFSFDIEKPNYSEDFEIQVETEPLDAGIIKINQEAYSSGWITVNKTNQIEFIPHKPGATLLKATIKDKLNGIKEVAWNFQVENPDIILNVTNNEKNITIHNLTSCNLAIHKANYNNGFDFEITSIPANSGSLKIDNSPYSGGFVHVQNPDNIKLDFTPTKEGLVLLEIHIKDQTGAETTKTIEYNVQNPPLILTVNNPAQNLSIGQTARFTIKADKKNYSGNFDFEITAYPYGGGDITVNGNTALSGILNNNPAEVTYTAYTLGNITLKVKVSDSWGGVSEKQVDFNVSDTPLSINILNQEKNIVLNQPTSFNFTVSKPNYQNDKTISYSISPARNILINNTPYSGGVIQTKYSEIKNGLPITFTPDRIGTATLTINAYDQYNQNVQKTLDFNISDPRLNVFLSNVNEAGINPINLNETYKFTLNVSKDYYSDDFAYWIESPAGAALLAANDVTPRSRTVNDNSGTLTGTLPGSEFGMSTAEIRITANNQAYLDKDIDLKIRVRDRWENEITKTITFHVTTSTINLNVVRNNTSIPVLKAYDFYFTTSKPNYEGDFKFSITGAADEDLIEISNDGSTYNEYKGGRYNLPDPDHTYIRYTPHNIGTAPLILFVYDDNSSYVEKNISFDVRAPQVQLNGGGIKAGVINEFIPFALTAIEEQGNSLNVQFNVDETLDGSVLFNKKEVYSPKARSVMNAASTTIASGTTNNLEIMSRKKGVYHADIAVSNQWNATASTTTTVDVDEPQNYTLIINKTGEGEVKTNPNQQNYPAGSFVEITAIPASGYVFKEWQGNLSGTSATQRIQMNSNKTIKAVFEKKPTVKAYFNLTTNVSAGSTYEASRAQMSLVIKIKDNTGAVVAELLQYDLGSVDKTADIVSSEDYELDINPYCSAEVTLNMHSYLVRQSESFSYTLANGKTYSNKNIKIKGADLLNGTNKFNYSATYTTKTSSY